MFPITRTPAGRIDGTAQPASKTGGTSGNERLTAATAVVLFVLLFVEGITILMVHPLFSEHVFVGMMLVPPVLLKLASTGYRFTRYYSHDPEYRSAGPPQLLLRVLAPVVVLSTLGVFGTGVALLLLGPRYGWMVGLHKASFIVWFGVTAIHVLAYLPRIPRLAAADWRTGDRLGGSLRRRAAVGVSLGLGLALAVASLPDAQAWMGRLNHH